VQVRRDRYRWILKIGGDIDAGAQRLPNQGRGPTTNRKSARTRAGEVSLPDLLNRLELALTGIAPRTSVFRALTVLNRRLGSFRPKPCYMENPINGFVTSTPDRRRIAAAVFMNSAREPWRAHLGGSTAPSSALCEGIHKTWYPPADSLRRAAVAPKRSPHGS
jgi:hypothetical protein